MSARKTYRSSSQRQRTAAGNCRQYEAVVVGLSAGGLAALDCILPALSIDFPLALIVVQHAHPHTRDFLANFLDNRCRLPVKQAEENETITPGRFYLAPPNYHLEIAADRTFLLTVSPPVNFARPAIDVLFRTAAKVYGPRLIGVILTGASMDGSQGLNEVKARGGLTVVQTPASAEMDAMPRAALTAVAVDYVLPLEQIGPLLTALAGLTPGAAMPGRL